MTHMTHMIGYNSHLLGDTSMDSKKTRSDDLQNPFTTLLTLLGQLLNLILMLIIPIGFVFIVLGWIPTVILAFFQ